MLIQLLLFNPTPDSNTPSVSANQKSVKKTVQPIRALISSVRLRHEIVGRFYIKLSTFKKCVYTVHTEFELATLLRVLWFVIYRMSVKDFSPLASML